MRTLIIVLIALTLGSCSAQWHLKKALKKDPTILKKLDTVIRIDTVVKWKERFITPPSSDTSDKNFNADSLIKEYKRNGEALLLENKKLKASIKNVNGKPTVVVDTKADTVYRDITKRITITKTIPGKLVVERVMVRGFFYWTGVVVTSLIAIFIIIFLITRWNGITKFFSSRFG